MFVAGGEEKRGKLGKPLWGCPRHVVPLAAVPLEAPCRQGCRDFCCMEAEGADTNTLNRLLLGVGHFGFGVFFIWLYVWGFY